MKAELHLFSELPRRVLLGNWASGIHLCYSAWQVGLPKEAGSKEHKMSIFPTKILLATDGSKEATLAARTAADLARKTESELHLLHSRAVPMLIEADSEAARDVPYAEETARREAQKVLDAQVEQIKALGNKVTQTHVRLGRPVEQIGILAEEIRAGLIVMGSRGLGGIKRALMGSVSDSVVHHARCSVLVVRAGENWQVTAFSQRILLATDGSKNATLATQAATEIATKTGADLHLVHVKLPPYDSSYFEGINTGDYLQDEEAAELKRNAQELLNKQVNQIQAAGGRVVQVHPRVGIPQAEITDLAEEIGAILVVVGSRGRGTMSRVLMGSVSDSVVHHAHCSVLVVRKEEPTD